MTAQLDLAFHALADPTRRAILARLAEGEATVSELAAPFQMTQPAISKHLRVLEKANLIASTVDGQRRPRRLQPQTLAQTADWIREQTANWETNYQRLDALLDTLQNTEDPDA